MAIEITDGMTVGDLIDQLAAGAWGCRFLLEMAVAASPDVLLLLMKLELTGEAIQARFAACSNDLGLFVADLEMSAALPGR